MHKLLTLHSDSFVALPVAAYDQSDDNNNYFARSIIKRHVAVQFCPTLADFDITTGRYTGP